tara:strand:- start:1705 stop:2025 length:321 start_codon:yes stop_codon:yes gene_type:complete
MKYAFISTRLWNKELGKASHFQNVRTHKAGRDCEMSTKLTEKYLLLKQSNIKTEVGQIECFKTFEIVTTCCGQRLALLPCELGWKFYHNSKSQVTVADFNLEREVV